MSDTLLRSGYTTGTCAAAAAKAAALALRGEICHAVEVILPDGTWVTLPMERVERISDTSAEAAVIKDAGDDPDITDGMTVEVYLRLQGDGITFVAGTGVGTVTAPGLQLPPGEPAINPAPRRMIVEALHAVLGKVGCQVTVSIPGGAETAAKTFNPRLGITGGLSILGTTGRVEPKSEEAWLRSLIPQIDVALAAGYTDLYLVPGGFGEAVAREQLGAPAAAIIHASNFIGEMLRACAERGVHTMTLVGHAGKLVKVAAGIFNTHSRFGDARLETVAAHAAAVGASGPLVAKLLYLPTVEAAVPLLAEAGLECVWTAIANRAAFRASVYVDKLAVECVLVDYQKNILGYTALHGEHTSFMPQSRIVQEKSIDEMCLPRKLQIVGIGPGPANHLTPAAWQAIRQAEVLVGGKRHLEALAQPSQEQIPIQADIAAVVTAIRERIGKRMVVLASGDAGCFGILAALRREFSVEELDVTPGISAMQLALARLGESWEDVTFASAHGRAASRVVEAIWYHPRVLAFTDAVNPAQRIAAEVFDAAIDCTITVLERLAYPDECITTGAPEEIAQGDFDPLAVVWLTRE